MDVRPASRSTWSIGAQVGALSGVATGLVAVVVIAMVWSSCGVGVNASANSGALVMLAPVIWLATATTWAVLYGALGKLNRVAAAWIGTAVNLWLLWFLVSEVGSIASYPTPACPGNVPTWWPSPIPL